MNDGRPTIRPDVSHFLAGDVIPGQYHPDHGGMIKAGGVFGDAAALRLHEKYVQLNKATGGEPALISKAKPGKPKVPTKAKAKKEKIKKETEAQAPQLPQLLQAEAIAALTPEAQVQEKPQLPTTQEDTQIKQAVHQAYPHYKVTFSNNFGRITMKCSDVWVSPRAFGLVFQSDEDLLFVPKPTETLEMIIHAENVEFEAQDRINKVFYPDVMFKCGPTAQVMVLMRVDDELMQEDEA